MRKLSGNFGSNPVTESTVTSWGLTDVGPNSLQRYALSPTATAGVHALSLVLRSHRGNDNDGGWLMQAQVVR